MKKRLPRFTRDQLVRVLHKSPGVCWSRSDIETVVDLYWPDRRAEVTALDVLQNQRIISIWAVKAAAHMLPRGFLGLRRGRDLVYKRRREIHDGRSFSSRRFSIDNVMRELSRWTEGT